MEATHNFERLDQALAALENEDPFMGFAEKFYRLQLDEKRAYVAKAGFQIFEHEGGYGYRSLNSPECADSIETVVCDAESEVDAMMDLICGGFYEDWTQLSFVKNQA